jgi:hypothetical protein
MIIKEPSANEEKKENSAAINAERPVSLAKGAKAQPKAGERAE